MITRLIQIYLFCIFFQRASKKILFAENHKVKVIEFLVILFLRIKFLVIWKAIVDCMYDLQSFEIYAWVWDGSPQ